MSFEIIEDVKGERKLIENLIKKHGTDPEQNYGYFIAHDEEDSKCVFVRDGEYGIQATYSPKGDNWVMIGTPIVPKKKQAEFFSSALDFLSKAGKLKKFVAEFETEEKKEVVSTLSKKSRYSVHQPNCTLYWPIYDMETWTGDELKGGSWKKLRNMINRVKKSYKVKLVDAEEANKEDLKHVVKKWAKLRNQTGFGINRKYSNRTDYAHYLKLIDLNFTSCDFAKTVMVNGKAASLTAGWDIPNSKRAYYSGIGVYDLSIPNLGEYANWRDLAMLKEAGYREVNFGGSPKSLLQFKMKFKPVRTYTTYIFAVTIKKRLC